MRKVLQLRVAFGTLFGRLVVVVVSEVAGLHGNRDERACIHELPRSSRRNMGAHVAQSTSAQPHSADVPILI